MRETEKKLNVFLVEWFIGLLLLVSLAEYGVMGLINKLLIPVIQKYFFAGSSWDGHLSASQILFWLLLLLVGVILAALQMMLPSPISSGIGFLLDKLESSSVEFAPELFSGSRIRDLSNLEAIYLFLCIFVVIVLIVAPFVIAASIFARIIVKEMRKIKQKQDEVKQEYDRKRNLMLSDIAHDLRTPITTISGYAKALQDGMITNEEKKQEYMDAIVRKSLRMNDLINLLFDYVKLDSEGFLLNKKQVDLTELVRENAALAYSDLEEKGMELQTNIPEEACFIWLDPIQFSRVITNLLVNAMRHNDPGTRVLVEMNPRESGITVVVADTGEEIPEETASHIFEPFARGDKSRNTNAGSGLGLSIAHKIIEMHGWKMSLRNDYPGYTKAFVIEIRI